MPRPAIVQRIFVYRHTSTRLDAKSVEKKSENTGIVSAHRRTWEGVMGSFGVTTYSGTVGSFF